MAGIRSAWWRTGLVAVGILSTTTAASVAGGPAVGLALGVGVVIAWVVGSPPYAFAAGHVGLLAFVPSPGLLLAFEGGLFLLLCPWALDTSRPALVLGTAAATIFGVWAFLPGSTVAQEATWAVAAVLLLASGFLAYGLDRYERVRFDLLGR